MPEHPSHARAGAYLGTTIGDSWYRRYRRDGFFARGSGRYWLDSEGLHFLRTLTRSPLLIPSDGITRTSTSSWHAGRWGAGIPFLRVHWTSDGEELISGFAVSRDRRVVEALGREIEAVASRRTP